MEQPSPVGKEVKEKLPADESRRAAETQILQILADYMVTHLYEHAPNALERQQDITKWRRCFLLIAAAVPFVLLTILVVALLLRPTHPFFGTNAAMVLIVAVFACFTITYAFIIRSLFRDKAESEESNIVKEALDIVRKMSSNNH